MRRSKKFIRLPRPAFAIMFRLLAMASLTLRTDLRLTDISHAQGPENDPSEFVTDSCPVDPCGGDLCCENPGSCGCNVNEEIACFNMGGNWNESLCHCELGCDPFGNLEMACLQAGGIWNATTCSCQISGCNPGWYQGVQAPVTVDYDYCNPATWTVWSVHGAGTSPDAVGRRQYDHE